MQNSKHRSWYLHSFTLYILTENGSTGVGGLTEAKRIVGQPMACTVRQSSLSVEPEVNRVLVKFSKEVTWMWHSKSEENCVDGWSNLLAGLYILSGKARNKRTDEKILAFFPYVSHGTNIWCATLKTNENLEAKRFYVLLLTTDSVSTTFLLIFKLLCNKSICILLCNFSWMPSHEAS